MNEKQVKKDKIKGLVTLVTGFLAALMGFLATINIEFSWLTEDSINAFGVLLFSAIILAVNVYAIWKNTFTTRKAQEQNEVLYKSGKK